MEIVIAWKKFTQKLMFKIDLIVWKYENKSKCILPEYCLK